MTKISERQLLGVDRFYLFDYLCGRLLLAVDCFMRTFRHDK